MPTYEVCLTIEGLYWTDVEADSEEEAEKYARETMYPGDAQSWSVTDADVKRYADA